MQSDCMPTQSYDQKKLSDSSSSTTQPTAQATTAQACPPGKSTPRVVKRGKDGTVTKRGRRKVRPLRHIDLLMTNLINQLTVQSNPSS